MRAALVGILAAGLVMTGCAASEPGPRPTPSRSIPVTVTIHEVDADAQRVLQVPPGTASARIEIVCTGGSVGISIDDEFSSRMAECGTPRRFTIPLHDDSLALEFQVVGASTPSPAPTEYTATVVFLHEPFHQDPVLTRSCALAIQVEGDVLNVDNGLLHGDIDPATARSLLADAATKAATATDDDPVGAQIVRLRDWLAAHPTGDPRTAPGVDGGPCLDNETPLQFQLTY